MKKNIKRVLILVKKTELILNNIHNKYNFRIQPVNRPEEFTMNNEGSRIIVRYPTKLDFNKSDSIPIYFYMDEPEKISGIRLNPYSEELDRVNPNKKLKKCLVPKSHFKEKESGYYYIYYINRENGLNIFYDISPILVILDNELIINIRKEYNKNIIKIGNNGTIALITDCYDINNNIFNSSDIEDIAIFKGKFIGYKKYNSNCKLWKPKNEKIIMICKFDKNLENGNIKLNRVISKYKEKKYYIYSEENLIVEQLKSKKFRLVLLYSIFIFR